MNKRKFLTIIFLVSVAFAFIIPHLTSAIVFPSTTTGGEIVAPSPGELDLSELAPPLPPPDLPPPPGGSNIISENEGTQRTSTKITSPDIECGVFKFDKCVLKAIFGLFIFINKQVLTPVLGFFGSIIDSILKMTTFANNTAIRTGWTIMRDIANMFFILIMVLIAIATILRIPSYNVKQLLKWVILIAILVNFSRVIAFLVIDFSHVFANAFLNALGENISGSIVNTTLVGKAAGGPDSGILFNSPVHAEWSILAGPIIQSVILLIAIVALAVAALVFIVRIIVLWMLIMVAPLAFIGFIIPGLKGHTWSKWWSALFKWSFIAPIYLFFVYIAIAISKSGFTNTIGNALGGDSAKPVFEGVSGNGAEWISMIVIVGFLIGGLKFALSMSGTLGTGAVRLGQRGAAMAGGAMAYVGRKGTAAIGRRAKQRYERLEAEGKAPTGVSGVGYQLAARISAGAQEHDRQNIVNRKKDLEKRYGNNELALQAKLMTATTTGEKAAIASRLDDIGGMTSGNPAIQRRVDSAAMDAARRGFRPKSRPDLAAEGIASPAEQQKAINKAIQKLKPKDVENLSAASIDPTKIDPKRADMTLAGFTSAGTGLWGKITTDNDQLATKLRDRMEEESKRLKKNDFKHYVNDEIKPENPALAAWLMSSPVAIRYRN